MPRFIALGALKRNLAKDGKVPSAEHHRYELEGLVFIVEWTLARSMYDSPLSAKTGPSRLFPKAETIEWQAECGHKVAFKL